MRFDGKVAIITGAGGGLGRSHALLFASRGAKVVVNDLGGSFKGEGKSQNMADKVVSEIREAGGEAVANYDSVEDGDKIVKTAMDEWGRIDILVNNAGILRDISFQKMSQEDWDLIYKVHVLGSFRVTHAVWPIMREQQYGRIVMTASAAGIYGNFGQANYSMAKLGLLGFSNTLAIEGRKKNIYVNTIAPIAGSRMTETVLPANLLEALKPEYVSPLVARLCHEDSEETGGLFEVGGGFFGKLRWERSTGKMFRVGRNISIEDIDKSWNKITSFAETEHPDSVALSMQPIMENVAAGPSKGGNEFIDVDQALGYKFDEVKSRYDERDLAIYALGVGAARSATDDDLKYVYEMYGGGMKALPTFGVVPALNVMLQLGKEGKQAPGLNFGLDRLLHGEQYTELKRPLPTSAKLTHRARVKDIFDKGKHALVITEVVSYDEDGNELVRNELTSLIRGAGGWDGDRGPQEEVNVPPDRKPDKTVEEKIPDNQALLYRLSGDWNPLHADPGFAKNFGYERPILHGLCTFGYAGRHVIESFAPEGNPDYFKAIKVRFADTVFPGETLVTEMWKESDQRIVFQCKVKERDSVVISHAAIELFAEIPKKQAKPKARAAAAAAPGPAAPMEPTSWDVFIAMRDHVERNPDLVGKVGDIFLFKLKDPDSAWTLDLKNAPGSVTEGESAKPDCTLEIAEADFLDMTMGRANPMKLFTTGKLKVSGNIMASQKLDFLQKIDPEQAKQAVIKARAAGQGPAGAGAAAAPAPESMEPTAWDVFIAMRDHVERNPDLVGKVGEIFLFKLKDPDSAWTLDLKNAPGSVEEGESKKPDCTLEIAEADFLDMTMGKANPMKLFTTGKLKISGNIMASQKLEFLQKIDPEQAKQAVIKARAAGQGPAGAAAAGAPAPESMEPTAWDVFIAMRDHVERNPDLVGKVGDIFLFRLKDPDSAWTLDLKNAPGSVEEGESKTPDCTLEIAEADFLDMTMGKANPMTLFTTGKLKISGNIMASQKLEFLQKIDPEQAKQAVIKARAAGQGPKAAGAGAAAEKKDNASAVFEALAKRLEEKPELKDEVAALVQFRITDPDASWVVDLAGESPKVETGECAEPTATMHISDAKLGALVRGETSARDLFQRGDLRVDGDITVAHRLGFLKGLI